MNITHACSDADLVIPTVLRSWSRLTSVRRAEPLSPSRKARPRWPGRSTSCEHHRVWRAAAGVSTTPRRHDPPDRQCQALLADAHWQMAPGRAGATRQCPTCSDNVRGSRRRSQPMTGKKHTRATCTYACAYTRTRTHTHTQPAPIGVAGGGTLPYRMGPGAATHPHTSTHTRINASHFIQWVGSIHVAEARISDCMRTRTYMAVTWQHATSRQYGSTQAFNSTTCITAVIGKATVVAVALHNDPHRATAYRVVSVGSRTLVMRARIGYSRGSAARVNSDVMPVSCLYLDTLPCSHGPHQLPADNAYDCWETHTACPRSMHTCSLATLSMQLRVPCTHALPACATYCSWLTHNRHDKMPESPSLPPPGWGPNAGPWRHTHPHAPLPPCTHTHTHTHGG